MPSSLPARIEALLEGVSRKDLGRIVEKMSEAYSAGKSSAAIVTHEQALAYVVARAPATHAAAAAVLDRVREALPDFVPQSLLDVGAGPGTASWAAREQWPNIAVTMLDNNPAFRALAAELIEGAEVIAGDLGAAKTKADLVIASYVLAEFPVTAAAALANDLWQVAGGMLVLIEPGTPQGFARIRSARSALIEAGAHIAAPCTHENACPMSGGDWCHFSIRLARSRAHMIAKSATVPFEDERYTYVVAVREPVSHAKARIIKPPLEAKPGITLPLCEADGLRNAFIPRRDREAYKRARKMEWGDLYSPSYP